jgi:superfamily I DNA/RNA helicase
MNDKKLPVWCEGLEGDGRRIAEIECSPLRVKAGPGTGKTFALMRRAARLIETKQVTDPSRVLVCTFTRTAADDLRKELNKLKIEGVGKIYAGTIHSFCFSLLRKTEVLKVTGRVPRPLLDFERRFLLEDIAENFGGIRECRKRLEAFSAAWARNQADEPGWPQDPSDRAFDQTLKGWLRFHNAMLIGELVPETLSYLRNNPLSPYRPQFDHVLVDEYQDLNKAEQILLDLLAEKGTLTIVGDENQSIYQFKHAHPEGIRDFDQTHDGTHDEDMTASRRCPRLVIDMANNLIAYNVSNVSLTPLEENPDGEVYNVQWLSIHDEAEGIANFVKRRVENGEIEAGKVLVLAPRRKLGYAIRDALVDQKVEAHSFFHEEILEGKPSDPEKCMAQKTYTLLSLLVNKEDRVSLRCWCGFESSSLRRGAWKGIREYCTESGDSPWIALEKLYQGQISISYGASLLPCFQELGRRLVKLKDLQTQDLVDALYPESEEWTSAFRALAQKIPEEKLTPIKLLEHIRSSVTQPELPTDVDYVRVMSLYKSKGLTADLVVVAGCVEGLIPSRDFDGTEEDKLRQLEEQRRLFYVAITRTKKILVLSSFTSLPRDLAHRIRARVSGGDETFGYTVSSAFLTELGRKLPPAVSGNSVL